MIEFLQDYGYEISPTEAYEYKSKVMTENSLADDAKDALLHF